MTTTEPAKPAADETAKPAAAEPAKPAADAPAKPAADETAKPAAAETAKEPPLPDTADGQLVGKARAAFDIGDFKLARAHAEGASRADDPAVRRAADDILARTRLDPVQLALFGGCLALLLGITYWFVLR